jgi:hypothetical protein
MCDVGVFERPIWTPLVTGVFADQRVHKDDYGKAYGKASFKVLACSRAKSGNARPETPEEQAMNMVSCYSYACRRH